MFLFVLQKIQNISHTTFFNRSLMNAIACNQSSWLHVQVQGGNPMIVHRKMSSFSDAKGRRKKKR